MANATSVATSNETSALVETPQNGLAGLKHWQYDMRSGFMVAMISLPFSMGIAIASDAPPICGIVSAIIAGFILPFLGGSYVTISGPAAGLAPSISLGIITLGTAYLGKEAGHDEILKAGYPLVLVAIFFAGALQVVLAKLKVARFCAIFPAAAIEGMLASIGLMIIVKQFPHFLGQKFAAHEFWHTIAEVPQKLTTMNSESYQVLGLGVGCVALLFILAAIPSRLLKVMPPPVWVFFLGTIVANLVLHLGMSEMKAKTEGIARFTRVDVKEHAGQRVVVHGHGEIALVDRDGHELEKYLVPSGAILHVEDDQAVEAGTDLYQWPRYLINVPNPLEHGIVLPEFATVFSKPDMWFEAAYMIFLLLLIDGTESLATIMAVDKLDPYRRRSSPDRTLHAMGVSNVASSILGGLTIIPGIVKSTANIMGGGRTQWANFYNACFLLVFLLLARPLINTVPYVVLASILFFVGFKLCRPKVWRHVAHIGMEQLVIFTFTVLVTVTTDLLIGIVAGVALKLALNLWYVGLAYRLSTNGHPTPSRLERALSLFRNPVGKREFSDGVYELYLTRPLVCFNLFHVIRELQQIPSEATAVKLHFTKLVPLVDHTTAETLFHYVED
ncbi:MAG TPA: SulP family inorganic anion transporter, partial [Pirellulales bacterium]|nr:SulP family inorganic anion transporter [Pirellulales bacterium]